ncbi:MAG: VanW family protein [Clostridia bacterium]|nr:VanW family protein [Clostridia bacterium]
MTQNNQTTPRSSSSRKGKRVKARRRQALLGISALALIAVLCAVYVFTTVIMPKGIFKGVTFMDKDLAMMSQTQAEETIRQAVNSLGISENIELNLGNDKFDISTTLNAANIDAKALAEDAYNYGREGSFSERMKAIKAAKKDGYKLACDIAPDREALLSQIDEAIKAASANSGNALYELKGEEIIVNLDHGMSFDREKIADLLVEKITALDFAPVSYEPDEGEISVATLKSMVDVEMAEPTIDVNDPTCQTIIPGVVGYTLDAKQAEYLIENAESDTVAIPVTVTKPTYTDEQYKSMIFRDVLSSQSTSFNGNQIQRTANIRIAASDCETVIMPGEEFSYTEQVGRITREKGYQDALVFSQGEVVDGLGGGVCQVSSTIYMAAMYADMEITVRRNHSFVVSYTPVGQDATFVYGGQDFKFRNNTNFPIKIDCSVGKNSITVKIIGTQETPGKSVKVITEILSTNPFEEQHVYDPTLAPDEVKVKNVGYTGYKANTYRIIYIDGKEVSRNFEASSTYKRLDKVTLYGTDPNAPVVEPVVPPTEAPPVVEPVVPPTEAPTTAPAEAPTETTEGTTAAE